MTTTATQHCVRNYRADLRSLAKCIAEEAFEEAQRNGTDIEDLDIYEEAHLAADSTDLVIYTHHALALCDAVDGDTLSMAEEQVLDVSGAEGIFEAFQRGGLGGVACLTAYWIVYQACAEALEEKLEELRVEAAA